MKKPKNGMHCWSYLAIPLQVSDSSVFLLEEFCCPGGGDRDWVLEIQASVDVNLGVRAADPKDSMCTGCSHSGHAPCSEVHAWFYVGAQASCVTAMPVQLTISQLRLNFPVYPQL